MPETKEDYSEYFTHNRAIAGVLSLFSGFLFTAITILLTLLKNPTETFAQATIFFLTVTFYLTLYTLINNLEMGFHYIEKIPRLTLRVAPFFLLVVIFYLFGTATVMMFLLFDLLYLAVASGIIWLITVLISIRTVLIPFFRQSLERAWAAKK